MQTQPTLSSLRGLVASVVLTGSVMEEFSHSWTEMRAWCVGNGFNSVEWRHFPAQLVEAGRDAVCTHALQNGYDYVLMIDADAVFGPETLKHLLETAFITHPDASAVSAYAQLRHPPYLPVIDTGTGTWEVHYPGEGVLPCIRVGGHCILVKTAALRLFGPPWFRTRQSLRPVDAFREVDNYARIELHGENPFAELPEWNTLMEKTKSEHGGVSSAVGEDSGFCDALLAAGGRLYCNTNVATGHVTKKVLSARDLRDEMRKIQRIPRLAVGVLE